MLDCIGNSEDADYISSLLNELAEVNRATFVRRGERLLLVTDERELERGEQLWRKEPDGVKMSYFHTEEEYLIAIREAGLFCEEVRRPCFFGRVKYRLYNGSLSVGDRGLGESYAEHNPFTIFTVVKPV